MKQLFKRFIALLLALLMILPLLPAAKVSAISGSGIAKGIGMYLLKRSYAEISSYSISHDVPVLGGIAKLMLMPSQRADMKERAQVAQILQSVTAIEQSVSNLETQMHAVSQKLDKLSDEIAQLNSAVELMQWQMIALEQKISQQNAAITLNSSVQSVQEITGKYKTAWLAYKNMDDAADNLAMLQQEKENTTDESRLAELETEISSADADAVMKLNAFINVMSEGGGYAFASDLGNLQSRVWNAKNPTASYLGAYEAYLRQNYPFEHQIIGELQLAMQSCTDAMNLIFTLYSEYYSCMNAKYPDDPRYENYTPEFFMNSKDELEDSVLKMAHSTGYADYMIPEPIQAKELADILKVDPTFVQPECIDSSVTINGKSYPCYKVRANYDGQYYLILKSYLPKDQMVQAVSVKYTSSSGETIYRPSVYLDHLYTDDGQYRLISDEERPYFVSTAYTALLSHLRLEGALSELPQDAEHFLLYSNNPKSNNTWEMRALDAAQMGTAGAAAFSSNAVYDGTAGKKVLAIYRSVATDDRYHDGRWNVVDKVLLENQEITVRDGQILDLSGITVDLNNVTIRFLGEGTIISNPKIRLNNSSVQISTDQQVTIKNLNITAKNMDMAAIRVLAKDAKIRFEGANSVSGNVTGSPNKVAIHTSYIPGNPIAVSHGMYIPFSASVTVAGSVACTGSGGGAGICVNGSVAFNGEGTDAVLTATGSKSSFSAPFVDCYPQSVGAGIGGCFSGCVKVTTTTTSSGASTTTKELDLGLSTDYIGSNAVINISNLTVKASGANAGHCQSDDIGGVTANKTVYDVGNGGKISSSVLEAANSRISSKIAVKNDGNVFKPETYTISVYTHGSNGVTSNGVSIRLHGSLGSSGWISLSDCGNDRGDWSGTFHTNSVGTIHRIEAKTNANNYWFPGKIDISANYGGESITVYGGRWIGPSAKSLLPDDRIYKVTITTSNDANAGTDATIKLYLQDNDGTKTANIELSDICYQNDAFEKGDVETFYIYAPKDFGECRHAFLYSDHSNPAAGWKVAKIEIQNVQGSYKDDGYTVTTDYWYEYENTVNFGKYSGMTGAYYIEVKTGSKRGAGTNSRIDITLHGDKYSKTTEKINMSDMAGRGDNFEKNDLDCFYIGFNTNAIGNITDITIEKDNHGVGADWYLSYIKITEEVADGQQAKSYTFTYDDWIKKGSVKLSLDSESVIKSDAFIDQDILDGLEILEDGTYELTVDRNVTISEEILATLQETGKKLTVIMTNEDKPIYSISFDGTMIVDYYSLELKKGYAFADGNAMLDFLSDAKLPAGTKVKLYAENLGFTRFDKLVLFAKDENGNWKETIQLESEDGIIEIPLEDGKDFLINKLGAELPSAEVEEDPDNIPSTGDIHVGIILLLMLAAMTSAAILVTKNVSSKKNR